ncbi:MAG: NAD(P)-binding domain-containing protein [Chloroflexota bacterium]|nr:NAD(P)-binding domain-containing protein [Chloroflexota bacterium]
MNIAIIGAGNVGKALARAGVRAGHDITLSAAHPEHAEQAARETGARAAASSREAAASAELVILAVPYGALNDVVDELGDTLAGKTVVDTTNQVAPDFSGLAVEGTSAAEQIQQRAPQARVVKALNTAFAARQENPEVEGVRLDGYVAADDDEARARVLAFVESIGFRPVDAGSLKLARGLEWLGLLNMVLQIRHGWSWQGGWKYIEPAAAPAGAR